MKQEKERSQHPFKPQLKTTLSGSRSPKRSLQQIIDDLHPKRGMQQMLNDQDDKKTVYSGRSNVTNNSSKVFERLYKEGM